MKKIVVILIFVFLAACNSKNDVDLFQEAQTAMAAKDNNKALEIFNNLISEFPDSPKTLTAIMEIAKMYHLGFIDGISKTESLKKSVEYYKKANKLSPNSDKGMNALFLAAFIEANDLQDFISAKKTYSEFIEKYPESEMVQSARIEMQNLGKSPEELIKHTEK